MNKDGIMYNSYNIKVKDKTTEYIQKKKEKPAAYKDVENSVKRTLNHKDKQTYIEKLADYTY
jgi:hypothetical protein